MQQSTTTILDFQRAVYGPVVRRNKRFSAHMASADVQASKDIDEWSALLRATVLQRAAALEPIAVVTSDDDLPDLISVVEDDTPDDADVELSGGPRGAAAPLGGPRGAAAPLGEPRGAVAPLVDEILRNAGLVDGASVPPVSVAQLSVATDNLLASILTTYEDTLRAHVLQSNGDEPYEGIQGDPRIALLCAQRVREAREVQVAERRCVEAAAQAAASRKSDEVSPAYASLMRVKQAWRRAREAFFVLHAQFKPYKGLEYDAEKHILVDSATNTITDVSPLLVRRYAYLTNISELTDRVKAYVKLMETKTQHGHVSSDAIAALRSQSQADFMSALFDAYDQVGWNQNVMFNQFGNEPLRAAVIDESTRSDKEVFASEEFGLGTPVGVYDGKKMPVLALHEFAPWVFADYSTAQSGEVDEKPLSFDASVIALEYDVDPATRHYLQDCVRHLVMHHKLESAYYDVLKEIIEGYDTETATSEERVRIASQLASIGVEFGQSTAQERSLLKQILYALMWLLVIGGTLFIGDTLVRSAVRGFTDNSSAVSAIQRAAGPSEAMIGARNLIQSLEQRGIARDTLQEHLELISTPDVFARRVVSDSPSFVPGIRWPAPQLAPLSQDQEDQVARGVLELSDLALVGEVSRLASLTVNGTTTVEEFADTAQKIIRESGLSPQQRVVALNTITEQRDNFLTRLQSDDQQELGRRAAAFSNKALVSLEGLNIALEGAEERLGVSLEDRISPIDLAEASRFGASEELLRAPIWQDEEVLAKLRDVVESVTEWRKRVDKLSVSNIAPSRDSLDVFSFHGQMFLELSEFAQAINRTVNAPLPPQELLQAVQRITDARESRAYANYVARGGVPDSYVSAKWDEISTRTHSYSLAAQTRLRTLVADTANARTTFGVESDEFKRLSDASSRLASRLLNSPAEQLSFHEVEAQLAVTENTQSTVLARALLFATGVGETAAVSAAASLALVAIMHMHMRTASSRAENIGCASTADLLLDQLYRARAPLIESLGSLATLVAMDTSGVFGDVVENNGWALSSTNLLLAVSTLGVGFAGWAAANRHGVGLLSASAGRAIAEIGREQDADAAQVVLRLPVEAARAALRTALLTGTIATAAYAIQLDITDDTLIEQLTAGIVPTSPLGVVLTSALVSLGASAVPLLVSAGSVVGLNAYVALSYASKLSNVAGVDVLVVNQWARYMHGRSSSFGPGIELSPDDDDASAEELKKQQRDAAYRAEQRENAIVQRRIDRYGLKLPPSQIVTRSQRRLLKLDQ